MKDRKNPTSIAKAHQKRATGQFTRNFPPRDFFTFPFFDADPGEPPGWKPCPH